MTLLITSIKADSIAELKTGAEQAWAEGADAVEVRMDTYDGDPAELADYLKANRRRTWIVTCRSAEEGGHFRGDTMQRVSRLIAAARGTDAYVDFELADWRRSDNIRRKIRLASQAADGIAHRLILSAHDLRGRPADLRALVAEMAATREAAARKIAYQSPGIGDSFDALDLMHEHGGAMSAIALGEEGSWTRVLAKKLGAFASYCALDRESATAPGQVAISEMIGLYRWASIDTMTRVFGVIGDPVVHSMSPLLFNTWFARAGLNAVYLPLRVGREEGCLKRFLEGCARRDWLNVGGYSVTVPHKTDALRWVGDGADRMSHQIGALNTLLLRDGKFHGFNTDCHAAVASMAGALGCPQTELAGLPVDLLGTGGAARAVACGLSALGCRVTVYGRTPEKACEFTRDFGARAAPWEERGRRTCEVLVNCTSLGMWPAVDVSPMPAGSVVGCRLVFDLIYNPLETRLLKDARAAGCATLNGLEMFVRQATAQFELWTRRSPDMRDAVDLLKREIGGLV